MNTWFTAEKVAELEQAAALWVGTPFSPNAEAKGAGVSCQKLVSALYREVGFCDIKVPDVQMAHARHSPLSLVAKFMATLDQFTEISRNSIILPGDMLGFRIFRTVHHCGVAVSGGRFIHACDGAEVKFSNLSDPTWGSRLAQIWRPNEG